MYLYAERGYDETTVADIAERAGLTKRTFFRYFTDKREVLFFGSDHFKERFVSGVREADATASPIEAVAAGLASVAGMLEQDRGREFAGLRQQIVDATPELQERELIKLAVVASASAAELQARGVDPVRALLAAEAGISVLKVAFRLWVDPQNERPLSEIMTDCMLDLERTLAEDSAQRPV